MSSQLDIGSARTVRYQTGVGAIAALQTGASDAPPVLLVPGYTGSKEDFGPLLDPLAEAGFRPTAIDLPGQFESAPADDPTAYTPDRLGESVRQVAAQLGAHVHLLGHSFGGLVCRAAVIAEPAAFRSLVLMDSGPAALDGARRELIEMLGPALPELGVDGIYAASEAIAGNEPGYVPPPPALAEFYRRRFVAGSAQMLTGMGNALVAEPDRVAELRAVALPILVLYGADDDAWSPAAQQEMAVRLGAERAVIADAAHSPAVENPAATLDALTTFWRTRV